MTDAEHAIIRQAKQDLEDAVNKSDGTQWTMVYSQSRIRAAITQLDYLLKGEAK